MSLELKKGTVQLEPYESDCFRKELQQKQQEVKEREHNRQSYHYRNDKGGR